MGPDAGAEAGAADVCDWNCANRWLGVDLRGRAGACLTGAWAVGIGVPTGGREDPRRKAGS